MQVMCIDGKPIIAPERVRPLPEFVPLRVYEISKDGTYYSIEGYDYTIDGQRLEWHRRRFIPLSEIDEAERSAEHQHEAIIYAR